MQLIDLGQTGNLLNKIDDKSCVFLNLFYGILCVTYLYIGAFRKLKGTN